MVATREAQKTTDLTIGLEPIANAMEMDPSDLTQDILLNMQEHHQQSPCVINGPEITKQ